jgi:hypothetical protein
VPGLLTGLGCLVDGTSLGGIMDGLLPKVLIDAPCAPCTGMDFLLMRYRKPKISC